jgi:hypothetical protein
VHPKRLNNSGQVNIKLSAGIKMEVPTIPTHRAKSAPSVRSGILALLNLRASEYQSTISKIAMRAITAT